MSKKPAEKQTSSTTSRGGKSSLRAPAARLTQRGRPRKPASQAQDERDLAHVRHVLATTDPAEWRTLDELRTALGL